jgi:hypothetical protein
MRKNLPVIKNAKDRRVSGGERGFTAGPLHAGGVTESGIVMPADHIKKRFLLMAIRPDRATMRKATEQQQAATAGGEGQR